MPLTRRQASRFNTFEFWSRKLGRAVLVIGPSQFDAALKLEFDRDVVSYCERPPLRAELLPRGIGRFLPLDFWVRYRRGRQAGLVVFEPTEALSLDLLRRSLDESALKWDVWQVADLAQQRQRVRNLKQLRPYVSSRDAEPNDIRTQIASYLKQFREGRWDQIEATVQGSTGSRFARAIALMYHDGEIDLDLEAPLSCRTWVKAL